MTKLIENFMVKDGGAEGLSDNRREREENAVLSEESLKKQASGVIYCD